MLIEAVGISAATVPALVEQDRSPQTICIIKHANGNRFVGNAV